MRELENKLRKELDLMGEQNLTKGNLETIDTLAHALKSIVTYEAMKDSGYSNGYNNASYNSYNSYDRDRRGRNADASYRMRMDGGRDQRYSYEGYSRDLKEDLEHMLNTANDNEKHMIKRWISELH